MWRVLAELFEFFILKPYFEARACLHLILNASTLRVFKKKKKGEALGHAVAALEATAVP